MQKRAVSKTYRIQIRVTEEEKNQLTRAAELNKKTLSEYLISAALSPSIDTSKINFFSSINSDMVDLKKSLYIANSLLLLVGAEQLKSDDKIMEYYRAKKQKAEELFGQKER